MVYLAAAAALPASAVCEVDRVTGYVSKAEAQFDLRCGTLTFSGIMEGEGGSVQIAFQFFPSHLHCCVKNVYLFFLTQAGL